MSALRHLAAIRTRLINDPTLVAILGTTPTPDSLPAVYLGSIFDTATPSFPCVTIEQARGNLAVWSPKTVDPAYIVINCYSKKDNYEPSTMEEQIENLLHVHKTAVSTSEACFHEIRKVDWNTAFWDSDTGAWRTTSMYLVRASLF